MTCPKEVCQARKPACSAIWRCLGTSGSKVAFWTNGQGEAIALPALPSAQPRPPARRPSPPAPACTRRRSPPAWAPAHAPAAAASPPPLRCSQTCAELSDRDAAQHCCCKLRSHLGYYGLPGYQDGLASKHGGLWRLARNMLLPCSLIGKY